MNIDSEFKNTNNFSQILTRHTYYLLTILINIDTIDSDESYIILIVINNNNEINTSLRLI